MSDLTPNESSAEISVGGLYGELLSAWNRRDVKVFASLFSPDGTVVGFDGSQVGGSDVEAHLAPIFADHPTATYVWKIRELVPLAEDVVLLRAIVGMVPPGSSELNVAANAVQSLVAVRRNGAWQIALFQNTPAQYHGRPELAEQHTAEIQAVLNG